MSADDLVTRIGERQESCMEIASRLRQMGFRVDWQRVNRSYPWFHRWEMGLIPLGRLINATGIRRM